MTRPCTGGAILVAGIVLAGLGTARGQGDPATRSPFAWTADFDAARAASLASGKPLVLVIDTPEQRWDLHIEELILPDSALARAVEGFTWVYPDAERNATLRARFNVDGLPTLLVLGPNEENIHRATGFLLPKHLSAFLEEASRRNELFAQGLDWMDPPPPASDTPNPKYTFRTLPAPSVGLSDGIAPIAGTVLVKQGPKVFRMDEGTGEILGSFRLDPMLTDLSYDGGLLYAVDYCWSSGRPIQVADPRDGEIARTIVTRSNLSKKMCATSGIEVHDGRMWVLELTGDLHEIDPSTGDIVRTTPIQATSPHGLAFDGSRFVTLTSAGVAFLDSETGRIARLVPMSIPMRSLGFDAGRFFFMEQQVWGFDRHHDKVRVSPGRDLLYIGSLSP